MKTKDTRTPLERAQEQFGPGVRFSGCVDMHTGRAVAPAMVRAAQPRATVAPKAKSKPFTPKPKEGKHYCPGCGLATLDSELCMGQGRCVFCVCGK